MVTHMSNELFQGPCGTYYSSKKVQVLTARGGSYYSNKLYRSKTNKAFDVNISLPSGHYNPGEITHMRISPQFIDIEIIVGSGNDLFHDLCMKYNEYLDDDTTPTGIPVLYDEGIHGKIFDVVGKILSDPTKIMSMIMSEFNYQIEESYKSGVKHEKNRMRNILGL